MTYTELNRRFDLRVSDFHQAADSLEKEDRERLKLRHDYTAYLLEADKKGGEQGQAATKLLSSLQEYETGYYLRVYDQVADLAKLVWNLDVAEAVGFYDPANPGSRQNILPGLLQGATQQADLAVFPTHSAVIRSDCAVDSMGHPPSGSPQEVALIAAVSTAQRKLEDCRKAEDKAREQAVAIVRQIRQRLIEERIDLEKMLKGWHDYCVDGQLLSPWMERQGRAVDVTKLDSDQSQEFAFASNGTIEGHELARSWSRESDTSLLVLPAMCWHHDPTIVPAIKFPDLETSPFALKFDLQSEVEEGVALGANKLESP